MRAICCAVFRAFSWSSLKTIGGSYFSIISILVPLLGYVLAALDVHPLLTEALFPDTRDSESSLVKQDSYIRIQISYVGLTLVGLTTIIFQILCPAVIRSFSSEISYANETISSASEVTSEQFSKYLSKKPWYAACLQADESEVDFINSYKPQSPTTASRATANDRLNRTPWLEKNINSLNSASALKFQRENYKFLPMRFLIGLGFTVGYSLVLLPSLMFFWPHALEVLQWF